jgi:hypothetical protein
MRMVIISLIVLIVMIGVWVWFHFTSVEPVTSYYWENLPLLSQQIEEGNWEKAKDDYEHYYSRWEEARGLWVYFINQDEIDNIDSSIKRLQAFIKNKDKNMAQAELEHLRIQFNIIKENECLALDNIF